MPRKKHKLSGTKKWILIGALVFFAVQLALPAAVIPRQTQAIFGVADTSITIGDIPRLIWDAIAKALKTAGDVAYKNVLSAFLNNLAYNTATRIATSDWGQKPLFPTKPEELLKQAADVAAGDFLDSIINTVGKTGTCYTGESCSTDRDCKTQLLIACPVEGGPWFCHQSKEQLQECLASGCVVVSGPGEVPEGTYSNPQVGYNFCTAGGFSLCDASLGGPLQLQLNLMAREAVFDQKPPEITGKCPLSKIIDNFENQVTEWQPNLTNTQKSKLYLAEISKSFNPDATDVGAYFQILDTAQEEGAIAKEKRSFAQSLSGAFNSVTSRITGAVKTPAPLVENTLNEVFGKSIGSKLVYTGSPIADAIGVFTNTLANKLLKRILEQGVVPDKFLSPVGDLLGIGSRPGISAAKIQFAELRQTDYAVGGEIDILNSLASCPDREDPAPDTCVIDSRFSTAIQRGLTVKQALDEGLLDGTKAFGYDANGVEPEYLNGYPFRSLVILRKYRVIPVGWELAAKYIKNYAPGRHSLNTLIAEHDVPESPFYRLVDPNWVLKAPEVFCRRQGAGPKIQFEQALRQEDTNRDGYVTLDDAAITMIQRNNTYCADEQMCLAENEDGSCRKYGYCIEERPVWKLSGDACESQYNTCQAFQEGVAYLTNTVDYDGCNADNAGCQWYCQDYDIATNQWTCSNQTPPAGGNKISFNGNAESCNITEEGCNEFIGIKNSGANLVRNSGFEDFDDFSDPAIGTDGLIDSSSPDNFSYWGNEFMNGGAPCGNRRLATSDAYEGLTAARIHAYEYCPGPDGWYTIQYLDAGHSTNGRTFTVSFYAKRAADAVGCDLLNENDDPRSTLTVNIKRPVKDSGGNDEQTPSMDINVSDTWTRYTGSFTFKTVPYDDYTWNGGGTPAEMRSFTLWIRQTIDDPTNECDVIIDNVQVEEGSLSSYNSYEDSPKTYLRKAPDYLNCTGNAATDDPACNNFAMYCSVDEVGCQAYTSNSNNRTINGVITDPTACDLNDPTSCNQCPAEFVGCQAYRELPIEHAPRRPARDPVSFVASTGLSCPASAVGCEEYTNLEEVALGGEGKEYYSWIKQCVDTSDANIETYYTWEGSDEFGFQLKDYKLKISNIDGGPCTNMAAENTAYGANSWPNCVDNIDFDEDGDGVDEAHPAATCDITQLGINPDCAEFYDSTGNIFYRLRSRVIYADENCKSFRNTFDGPNALYHLIPGQGNSCQAEYAGCRAYKGNAGDNSRVVYEEDFEGGTVDPWQFGVYSNESVNFGGHSMLAPVINLLLSANDAGIEFKSDHSYTLSFWAKAGSADTVIAFGLLNYITAQTDQFPGQVVARAGEWNRYEVGPLYLPPDDYSDMAIFSNHRNTVYIDNIVITEVTENIYRVKDSYIECSGYENCDEYTDKKSQTHYLKSFSSLCSEDKVGCEAMIDTQNTYSPDPVDYPLTSSVDDTIPADEVVTIVNDQSKSCSSTAKGCERFGQPTIDTDGNVESFADTYIINNPDDYNSILCLYEEDSCREYTTFGGAKFYFKDPGSKTCEYKRVAGQNASGWYKFDTSTGAPDCPTSTGICTGGSDDGKLCNSQDDCGGGGLCLPSSIMPEGPVDEWVGLCPETESSCTEYQDPEQLKSEGVIISENLATNSSFEEPLEDGNLASWYTDGSDNTQIPDGIPDWLQYQTDAGFCNDNPEATCDSDSDCATGTCNTAARVPCGNRTLAFTGEPGVNPTDGVRAVAIRSYDNCKGGDSALYTWHYFDTGKLTDNRTFRISFDAKKAPATIDPACGVGGTNSNVFFGMSRAINQVENFTDYRPGHVITATDNWVRYEGDFSFPSVPMLSGGVLHDWQSTTKPLEELQSWANLIFRRDEEDPDGVDDICDVLIDNVMIQELSSGLDYNPYYYLKDTVDESSCNGIVSREEGCRLFNDTSNSDLPWSSADSENGEAPAVCTGGADCDSNAVISVEKDRICDRWLECSSTITQKNKDGESEELCQEVAICNDMDKETSHCTSWEDFTNANQTYSTPAFADKIKNYSGLVLAGLDWGKRCANDPNRLCADSDDCGGAECTAQIIEGSLPVAAMNEVGSVGFQGDLIKYGDFGDSNYLLNQELSENLSVVASPPDEIDISNLSSSWMPRIIRDGSATITWTEEDINYSLIPSPNNNLDENNVARVVTGAYTGVDVNGENGVEDANFNGIAYDLGENIIHGEEYYISFRLRWSSLPSAFDKVRVEFGYRDSAGKEFIWPIFADLKPTDQWQEYIFGPLIGGEDTDGSRIASTGAQLNIVYYYIGPDTVPAAEFYIDDVSLRPVLKTKDGGGLADRTGGGLTERDCRLYPKDDSLYCNYTDENKTTFNGWEGYCLERDPQHPKYCLNWWPVDLLKGESDLLSALRPGGYSGRVPLYYCAESRDLDPAPPHRVDAVADLGGAAVRADLPRITCVYRTGGEGGENDACEVFAVMSDPKPEYYNIINDPTTDYGARDWRIGQSLDYFDSFGEQHNRWWECHGSGTCNDCMNIAGTNSNSNGGNDGQDNAFCDVNYRSTCDGTSFSGCDNQTCGSNAAADLRNVYHKVVFFHWVTGAFGGNTQWRNCSDDDGEQSYSLFTAWSNTCALTDGSVDRNGSRCASSINGDIFDGFDLIGTTMANASEYDLVSRTPRPQECSVIVQTVKDDGENVAWTNRLNGNFTLNNHPLQYVENTNCSPYGGTPVINDPLDICIDWNNSNSCNTGSAIPEYYPLQLFHLSNPFNNDINQICNDVVGGEGYMSCGNWGMAGVADICDAGTSWGLTNETGLNQGVARLKRLFAYPYSYWSYGFNAGFGEDSYVQNNSLLTTWRDEYFAMPVCPYNAIAGQAVRPPFDIANPNDEYCGVPPQVEVELIGGNVETGGKYVDLGEKGGRVQFKVNIKADPEQEAIRLIEFDWDGDGTTDSVTQGKFASGGLTLNHVYQKPQNVISIDYTPFIKVIDNWQWCGVSTDETTSCPGDCRYMIDPPDYDDCDWIDPGITIHLGS